MATQMTGSMVIGTLIDGVVRLDEQVDIPNNSRVFMQIAIIAQKGVSDEWHCRNVA